VRNDCTLLPSTLDVVIDRGLLAEVATLHLDGSGDGIVRSHCLERGRSDCVVAERRKTASPRDPRGSPRDGAGPLSERIRGCPISASCAAMPTGLSLPACPVGPGCRPDRYGQARHMGDTGARQMPSSNDVHSHSGGNHQSACSNLIYTDDGSALMALYIPSNRTPSRPSFLLMCARGGS
jgi:hypothetical protein